MVTQKLQFANLDALNKYTNTVNNFQVGELVYLEDRDTCVMYNGKEFVDIPKEAKLEGNGLQISLYELNKSIVSQLAPKLTVEEQEGSCALINDYRSLNGNIHYMLLCKDISYYTIFEPVDSEKSDYAYLGNAVLDCVSDIGQFICADLTEDKGAIELWVRTTEEENLCMYLFGCEQLIVTYAR